MAAVLSLPADQLLAQARMFANERTDTNPVLAYTVGTRKAGYTISVTGWTREAIACAAMLSATA